jgi:hypothetical protein
MRTKTHQSLEAQLRRIEAQREDTRQKLRALARHTQCERRYQYGMLVELAGLKQVDSGTLLGGLCEVATMLAETQTASRWKAHGDVLLEAHRQRKAHRKRSGVASAEAGASGLARAGHEPVPS